MDELRPDDLAYLSRTYRVAAFVRKVFARPDQVAVLRRREEVGAELQKGLSLPGPGEPPKPDEGSVPEVVVVKLNARKRWAYPEADERLLQLAPSSWYKFEVKGVSDAFLEVFGSLTYVTIEDSKARPTNDPDEGDLVYLVGRIPLESISHIDWSPDPAYWRPRLYVRFRWAGPFREVAIFEKRDRYLFELHDVKFKRPRRRYLRELRMELQRRREVRRED